MFRNVAIGISGGVDSAVSAYLLKQRGFNVTGVFMQNWDWHDETTQCTMPADITDAKYCCDHLAIPFRRINFAKEYWNYVFNAFIEDYTNGLTPNPDILCNRFVKFNYFYRWALDVLAVDAIATGHYVRTTFGNYLDNYRSDKNVRLLKPKDSWKDQTFFLSQVDQEPLRKTMFPLGDRLKVDVKRLAIEIGLGRLARKKESMGICFIGNRNFRDFIAGYIENKPGEFVDIATGRTLATHNGIHFWTIGQRSRISLNQNAYYCVARNRETNQVLVADCHDHAALLCDWFVIEKPHWIDSEPQQLRARSVFRCEFKFQHVYDVEKCSICYLTASESLVILERFQRALAPGQFAVFYAGDICLGSGRILRNGPSKFLQSIVGTELKNCDKKEVEVGGYLCTNALKNAYLKNHLSNSQYIQVLIAAYHTNCKIGN